MLTVIIACALLALCLVAIWSWVGSDFQPPTEEMLERDYQLMYWHW